MELPELTQDWGNNLEGTNRNLRTPGPRRKEQWPHKRLTQTCPWVSRSLWQSCGSAVACCRVGGTGCSNAFIRPFEGGRHCLHYLHQSLASGQITGREHSPCPSTENWIKDLLSMAPFAFQSPIMKKASSLGVSSRGLVGLHRTVQLQLLQHYWSGHSFGLLWYWMVCLGNEQRSFCHFWDRIQVLHFGLFFFSIQKTKIMASGPITSWQINGEIVEAVTDFTLGGSKITVDGNGMKLRHLFLGRKAMNNLDSLLKSRDITL